MAAQNELGRLSMFGLLARYVVSRQGCVFLCALLTDPRDKPLLKTTNIKR
jgi:hypothetical protein